MYGLSSQNLSRWDSISDLEWCKERLRAQHAEAHIMAYGYEDLNIQTSPFGVVEKAARNLLSELEGPKSTQCTPSFNHLIDTEDISVLDPATPVLFICRGFAGLVVKKVCMLTLQYAYSFD